MSAELEELTRAAAELNPIQLRVLLNFARMLKYAPDGVIDMSDPTPEDLMANFNEQMRRFEEEHGEEDWGDLQPMNPGERYK